MGSPGEQALLLWQVPKLAWPLGEKGCLNPGKLLPVPTFTRLLRASGHGRGAGEGLGEGEPLTLRLLEGTPPL